MTHLIDGKLISQQVRSEVKARIEVLKEKTGKRPCLAVVLVGEDPASKVYVSNKSKACAAVKMESRTYRLPETTTQEELEKLIAELNQDPDVNGILVQLPLPAHLEEKKLLELIHPEKDVDGFHPMNVGKMAIGDPEALVSCTPAGVIQLLKRSDIEIDGKRCVVAGRSNIVGKPMARLLLAENGTVTVCHSHTKEMDAILKEADIVVACVGKPKFFSGSQFKEGAVVIDVGIHRLESGLCGDVDTESCMGIVSAITPVPGGVGPMTIAMLLSNTVKAFEVQNKV